MLVICPNALHPNLLPGDLARKITACVDDYNNHHYQKSLGKLTLADVYFGRDQKILKM